MHRDRRHLNHYQFGLLSINRWQMSGEDSLSEGLIGFFSYIVVEFRACISGVDSYVRNVDAAGSNPAKSTGFFEGAEVFLFWFCWCCP